MTRELAGCVAPDDGGRERTRTALREANDSIGTAVGLLFTAASVFCAGYFACSYIGMPMTQVRGAASCLHCTHGACFFSSLLCPRAHSLC